jgi:hypothetical protein
LSWEGDQPSTAAAEEIPTLAAEESAPLFKAETVALVAEATLLKASVVEGKLIALMQPTSSSSHSLGTDTVCLVFTGAQVEGSVIP